MTPRLPSPGGDNNAWGQILNDFLLVEHGADGSLRANGTLSAYGRIRGAWVTATGYAVNDIVSFTGGVFRCSTAHTSGTFATDAANWEQWSPVNGTFASASAIASAVQASSTAATGTLVKGQLAQVDATSGAATRTLPLASAAGIGAAITVKKIDTSANVVTVVPAGADTIVAGGTSRTLNFTGEAAEFVSDGTSSWIVRANDVSSSVLISNFAPASQVFQKATDVSPCMSAPTGTTLQILAGTIVQAAGAVVKFTANTAVSMPTLTAGNDYQVYVLSNGTATAQQADVAAPVNSRLIGGFHYAPGGNGPNAIGTTTAGGGNTTAAINPYSIWDLKWRPIANPRGMTRVPGTTIWSDIYFMHVTYGIDGGWSRNGQTVADGGAGSLPYRATAFGGDGSSRYGAFTVLDATELAMSANKRLPSIWEYQALAFGAREGVSLTNNGTDFLTGLGYTDNPERFTSRCGVIQAVGCMWTPCSTMGGAPYSASGATTLRANNWTTYTTTRGQSLNQPGYLVAGGSVGGGVQSGSRVFHWYWFQDDSNSIVSGRAVSDHLGPVA